MRIAIREDQEGSHVGTDDEMVRDIEPYTSAKTQRWIGE
jgi:hypothetical protein